MSLSDPPACTGTARPSQWAFPRSWQKKCNDCLGLDSVFKFQSKFRFISNVKTLAFEKSFNSKYDSKINISPKSENLQDMCVSTQRAKAVYLKLSFEEVKQTTRTKQWRQYSLTFSRHTSSALVLVGGAPCNTYLARTLQRVSCKKFPFLWLARNRDMCIFFTILYFMDDCKTGKGVFFGSFWVLFGVFFGLSAQLFAGSW